MVTTILVAHCRILTQQQTCDRLSPYKTHFITYVGSRLGEVWKECSSVLAEDSSRRDGERVPQLGVEGCGAACRWQVIGRRPEREHDVSLRLMTRLVLPHRRSVCLCLCACASACERTEVWPNRWGRQMRGWGRGCFQRGGGMSRKRQQTNSQHTDVVFFFFFMSKEPDTWKCEMVKMAFCISLPRPL